MATSIEQPPSAAPCAHSRWFPAQVRCGFRTQVGAFPYSPPEFKDLRELKGKRLAVSTLFGSDPRAAEEIMRAKGFSPGDIKPVALGEARVRAQALRSGVVEAAAVSSPFDLTLKADGFRVFGGPQDIEFALPTSGLAVSTRQLQQNPQLVKRAARVMLKAHRLVFDNKKEVVPFMLRFLDQSQEVAERYELLVASLSCNGEITDQEWEILTRRSGCWKRSETLLCCARRGRSSRSVSAMYVRWVLGKSGKDRSEIMPARYPDS